MLCTFGFLQLVYANALKKSISEQIPIKANENIIRCDCNNNSGLIIERKNESVVFERWQSDLDFGEVYNIDIDAIPAGSYQGRIYVATQTGTGWSGGSDSVHIYYSTDGGATWTYDWLLHTITGKRIATYSIACSRQCIAFMSSTFQASAYKERMEGFILPIQGNSIYIAIDSNTNVTEPTMGISMVSDAEDFSSNIWFYLTYRKIPSGPKILFTSFNESGQIQNSCTIASGYECCMPILDWDFDNLFCTYMTFVGQWYNYATFSPDYGSTWNGPHLVGNNMSIYTIAGHNFHACIGGQAYDGSQYTSFYSFTTDFGNTWSGPLYYNDSREGMFITELDSENKYGVVMSTTSEERLISCYINCTNQGLFGFKNVQDVSYYPTYWAKTCCLWNSGAQQLGVVWIDERLGSAHGWFDCGTVGIEENITKDLETSLFSISPSLATNRVAICYELEKPSDITIEIFDITGSKIRTIEKNIQSTGVYSLTWNLRDNNHHKVSSGIYLIKFTSDNHFDTKQVIVVK